MSWLARLACEAPVPVYPAIGRNALTQCQDWGLDHRLQWACSPRHARILLVAGDILPECRPALRRLHDQLPSPSVTLWWRSTPLDELADQAVVVEDADKLGSIAGDVYRSLLLEDRRREPRLCPDEPPAPFEGRGDHGQGGEGMMGGKPYGRPMAMTADDLRDGLQLDPLEFSIGPFWPVLPPGLAARLVLHGDVIAEVEITSAPFPVDLPPLFEQALERPVPIADLEMARARYHLRQLAHSMWINGLGAASMALLRHVRALQHGDSIERFSRRLRRRGFFLSAGAGRGEISREQAERLGGPAARAAGLDSDARALDPEYRKLDFRTIVGRGTDCRARWQQWLDEASQSLSLAGQARTRGAETSNAESVEAPRGSLQHDHYPADASAILAELLPGLEWSEAMAAIASLDLAGVVDPREGRD